jgi:benzoyl-CoA reductase subunit C
MHYQTPQNPILSRQGLRIVSQCTVFKAVKGVGMNKKRPRIIGYTCSYVPIELVMAAGFTPKRLIPKGQCSDSQSMIHPNTCCYVKSMLSEAMAGAFAEMDAVVLANSCDAVRKLFDIWDAYIKRPAVIFMDIPKKQDAEAFMYFTSALRKLSNKLTELPGAKKALEKDLNEAITKVNTLRSVYTELFNLHKTGQTTLSGLDVFSLIQEGDGLTAEEDVKRINAFLQSHVKDQVQYNGKRRILVTGNILNSPQLISMIEQAGALVTGLDSCFGWKNYENVVEEGNNDPFAAIAERYLQKPKCARMMGVGDQIDYVQSAISATGADGVILSHVKFCDNLNCNIPLFQQAVETAGAKCLVLENDYEFSDIEKARTKVEAFLEILG